MGIPQYLAAMAAVDTYAEARDQGCNRDDNSYNERRSAGAKKFKKAKTKRKLAKSSKKRNRH